MGSGLDGPISCALFSSVYTPTLHLLPHYQTISICSRMDTPHHPSSLTSCKGGWQTGGWCVCVSLIISILCNASVCNCTRSGADTGAVCRCGTGFQRMHPRHWRMPSRTRSRTCSRRHPICCTSLSRWSRPSSCWRGGCLCTAWCMRRGPSSSRSQTHTTLASTLVRLPVTCPPGYQPENTHLKCTQNSVSFVVP